MPEQEQTHQHDHAADDGDCQIGFRRTHRAGRFIVRNPCIRRKGHDLKEHERRKQIRGQENADRRALRQHEKEVVAVAVAIVMGEVIAGKQRRHQPHHARHQRIQRTEAVQLEAQPETTEAGNRGGKLFPRNNKPHRAHGNRKLCQAAELHHSVAQRLIFTSDQIAANRRYHREKHKKEQHLVFPLSHITPAESFASSVIIGSENRPHSTMAAARTANGSFMRMPGSHFAVGSMPSSGRKYIDIAGPIR